MASLIKYIRDTRGELRHVAWPTQTQTTVYTVLVIVISILVAGYLGLFDFIFTGALDSSLDALGGSSSGIETPGAGNATDTPVFDVSGEGVEGLEVDIIDENASE